MPKTERRTYRIAKYALALLALGVPSMHSQPESAPQNPLGPEALGGLIADISSKDSHTAADFAGIASVTTALGETMQSQGQALGDSIINDALLAVEEGESKNPLETDWTDLRERLEKLLEKAEEQNQEQQEEEQQEDQESEENQENQEQDSGEDGESGESESENEDSESEGEQGDSKDQESPESQEEQSENGEQGEQSDQDQSGENGEKQSEQTQSPEDQLGNMDTPESQPELDKKSQGQEEETQKIGGGDAQATPISPKEAIAQQMLEKIKQQDEPGKLFLKLQEAEAQENAEDATQPQKNDW